MRSGGAGIRLQVSGFRLGLVSVAGLLLFAVACGGGDNSSTATPTPTTEATTAVAISTPTPSPFFTPTPTAATGLAPGEDPMGDQMLYLSLGDSLAYGNGASDHKRTAWVPLVAESLGSGYELVNLGVPGYTSDDLNNQGELDQGLSEISSRANDGVPGNEVGVITLEIGGNDLLNLYSSLVLTGLCPSVVEALQRPQCVDGLQNALDAFKPNLEHTLDELTAAAPGVPIFLATLYNPFSGGSQTLDEIGALALEGQQDTPFPDGLNDIIRAVGAEYPDVHLVEWYDLFLQKQSKYISQDLIHPNDTGQQVMANAMISAMTDAGLP